MIEEYFKEKQYAIDLLRKIYRNKDEDEQKLLHQFCNTKYAGAAIEMQLIEDFTKVFILSILLGQKKPTNYSCNDQKILQRP
jgi:hypothetical protein